MRSPVGLVFLCLAVFLVLFPLAVPQPGLPVTMKADEPAYYLMAESLARDRDIVCDQEDIQRAFDSFPYLPIENLILMTNDGWKTALYGKPFIYPLLAAPAVGLAGHRGMVAFNMLLLVTMIWMGFVYLRRFNDEWLAMLIAVSFFLLSAAFAYVFWLQPEILNMFGIAAGLFFAFHVNDERSWRAANWWLAPALSAAFLALAVYGKPMYAALGLAPLLMIFRRGGLRSGAVWLASALVTMMVLAGVSLAISGQPSAYLGSDRIGVKVESPERYAEIVTSFQSISDFVEQRQNDQNANSFSWLVRVPEFFPRMWLENLGYFLWGRHTGLLPYLPFGALAFVWFLISPGRGSLERWLLVSGMAIVALFFIIWIHYNWHGGNGFVGNRYFVSAYPAFLFLLTRVRAPWLALPTFAAAGMFVAPFLFAPYGAPTPFPTLQSHTRGYFFESLPVELSLRQKIPGYEVMAAQGVTFRGRKDQFRTVDPGGGTAWTWGARSTELWLDTSKELTSLAFAVGSLAPENRIRLALGGTEKVVEFSKSLEPAKRRQLVEIDASGAAHVRSQWGRRRYAYKLVVSAETGVTARGPDFLAIPPAFHAGAEITYLGTGDELRAVDHYRIDWRDVTVPDALRPGQEFVATAFMKNESDVSWSGEGPLPAFVGSRWLSEDRQVVEEGPRTHFARAVRAGQRIQVQVPTRAPRAPGSYVLVVDAGREGIGWFSEFGGRTGRLQVEIEADAADATDTE